MTNKLLPNTEFQKNSGNYINRFISLKAAGDMLNLGLFPNAKEITESYGAFAATQKLPEEFAWKNGEINLVSVGDGHTPRTAALFAFLTRWNCFSVDPVLRGKSYPVQRLQVRPVRIEDISLSFNTPTVIVCVHSHAKLSQCLRHIKSPLTYLINIPCCTKPDIGHPLDAYEDRFIWSEKNKVEIYAVSNM